MIRKAADCQTKHTEKMRGGNGIVSITSFASPEELNNKGRLFANITLKPGCSIGYHVHENESELFYVMKGEALYNDNGVECPVSAGDVMVCSAGTGHAVANNGEEDVELCAVILYAWSDDWENADDGCQGSAKILYKADILAIYRMAAAR